MRRSTLLVAVLLGAAGCQSDSGGAEGAERFEGTWRTGSATLVLDQLRDAGPLPGADGGTPTTITRTSTPVSLRGDYTFTASDTTHGQLFGCLGVVADDSLAMLAPMDGTVTLDGDDWIIAGSAGTAVYAGALAGDSLTLTLDLSDPRNQEQRDAPRAIVLSRIAAPPSATVGRWRMLEMDYRGLTVHGDTCMSGKDPDSGAKLQLTLDIDVRHMMQRTLSVTEYSDGECTRVDDTDTLLTVGLIEESAGTVELWAQPGGASLGHSRWTVRTPAKGQLELTRDCAPRCAEAPERLLLVKTN